MRNSNQILHDDQTRREENFFHGRQRMLTRDLFAIANLLVLLLNRYVMPVHLQLVCSTLTTAYGNRTNEDYVM